MDIAGGLVFFLIVCFLCLSGPIAFFWSFRLQRRLDDLAEQNAKLESTLQRLRQEPRTEHQEQPAQPVPVHPAAPVPNIQSVDKFVSRPSFRDAPFRLLFISPNKSRNEAKRNDGKISKNRKLVDGLPNIPEDPARCRFTKPGVPVEQVQATAPTPPPSSFFTKDPASLWRTDSEPVPAPVQKAEKPDEINSRTLELWIGQKLFGWVAVVGFIVAAALLIRYAVNEGWITDTLKVAGITTFGVVMLGAGFYSRRSGLRRFSTMLSSVGIILLYQAGYASFAFYKLISFQTASVLMSMIVLGGFLLAWFYRSRLLGIVSILGGLAVPILVSSGEDHYRELFVYLISLNIGTLLLVNLLRRAPIAWIAFFGTQALFWMWFNNYQPSKLPDVLLFQAAFYIVFLIDTMIAAWKPINKKLIPTWDDAMRAVLAPIIFFGAIYIVLEQVVRKIQFNGGRIFSPAEGVHVWLYESLGIFAFIGAAWYALLAVLYKKHLPSVVCHLPSLYWQAAPSAAVVIALGFVAIGIPLQFDAMWITLGWLTVFAGLWYFGHRQTNLTFVVMAYIFFGLGTVRLVTEIAGQLREVKTQLEMCAVFNTIALPMLASAAVLVAVAVLKAADDRRQTTAEKNSVVCCLPSVVFGILGYILLGIILSGEAARYFYAHPELWFYNPGNPLVWAPYPPEYLLEAFLTAFWFAWAILLLEIGFIFRSRGITTTAIVGLGLAVTIMLFVGFAQRVEYQDAINNPFCVALTAGSLILLALGYQSKHVLRRFDATYQNAFGLFGVVGLFTLIATLSIEWIDFTRCDIMPMAYAIKFLSALWALYALFWIGLGFFVRNLPIRICGLIVLFGALAKTVLYDAGITQPFQLGWVTPLMNAYFISMLFPVIPALVLAVWTNRCRLSYMGNQERIAWKVSGVIALLALLIYLSVECYHNFDVAQTKHGHFTIKYAGSAALTTLWSVFALILTTLALVFRSKVLRIISMSILLLTALKVFGDLPFRPEFTVPFWNPFSRPMMILAATILALGIFWVHHLDENSTERKIYRFFAFFGVCFLWLTMSVECFQSVRQLAGAGQEAWKAQMALSILWSLFAGVLIGIGFVWRSATLRWMAILLFAATLLKILIVDMSGVNELYRFGAVFALASLLMAATWAYQRFKPEA